MENVSLTTLEEKVFWAWACHPIGWVLPFQLVAESSGVDPKKVRATTRRLARKGLVELATGFNEDSGLIAGRGYMLSDKGEKVIRDIQNSIRLCGGPS